MANEISKIKLPNNVTYNITVDGLGAAAYKDITTSVTSGSSDLVTSGAVYTAIDNLPEPMIFKGSLGTGGTITTLPTASSANEGFTYKVITAGTYASQAAKVGDLFISNGTDWIWIPSGDEPSGTVTSVAIANGGGLSVSGSPITSSGTITISHADTSSQASVDNSGRTYIQDITLDTYGHVTKITSATETVVNTDRYVNSAAFANDTSGVKMTLTRAGSDTATVTGTIPLVSSSTAGVVPKGTAVSSQSQSTKFLREDGSWAAPSYTTNTNTTYTLSVGTGDDASKIILTPSSGTANKITVPYANRVGVSNPSGIETNYYCLTWCNPQTGQLYYDSGLFYDQYTPTSTTDVGDATLYLGNYISKGTSGCKYGRLRISSQYNGFSELIHAPNSTHYRIHTLPDVDGTVSVFTTTPTSGRVIVSDGTEGGLKTTEYTISKSVPSNAVFTDTTYTLGTSGNSIQLKPSNGGTQSITAPYATKAAQDDDGNVIKSTYLKLSGGTLTGRLTTSKTINNVVTGTGTAAQDKGSGVSPRYFPAKWTYNTGLTATNGDRLVVKIPIDGHSYGVYLSIDNGTTYYPVVLNGTVRVTTHYPSGTYIMVVFESGGSATDMFPLNGGDSRTTVTGGVWRIINYYDANSSVTQTATTGNANYEVLFSNTADNTSRTESARKSNAFIFNPTTGLKLGVSSQSAFPTLGIDVHDVRSVNFTPGALDRGANFFFSNNTMPNTNWWAGLHVKGWTGAYAAWEIVGSAHNNDSRTTPLYVRTSNLASTWGSWRKIYDTSNPPTKSEVGLGNVDNTADANKSVASATTAIKLSANAGSATNPVYFTGGVPTACTYSLNKTVPSDAVFTDTNTHRPIQVNGTEILGNNTTALNLKAGSNVSVTNSSGTVTIAATDTNTTYTLSADTTNNKITLTPSSGSAQSITVPYATSAGGVAWGNVTGKPSTFTPASHTHGIGDITWAGNANLKANASANNQEWSIDLTPGSYTGTYWQVWSAKNSKTILACYTDNNKVEVPNGDFYVTNGEVAVGYGIELGMASNDAAAHIDFHWNSASGDYTARIWQRGESTVDLIGKNSSTWGIWRAGSFSTQSSIHAKENIQDITAEDSKKLLQLRPVTFNYKNGGLTDQAGLIAEEVYLVMPKMVIGDINYNPEEPWNTPSIDYSKFVPYLIKMVQEQQKEIDELKEMINQ